jgi:hypothetical protein
MRPSWTSLLAFTALFFIAASTQSFPALHEKRRLSSDLEVSGALAGLPPGSTHFITRSELLAMPQVNFTVTDDTNFTGPTKIRGVKLEELARGLGASSASDMVVAICDDGYRANYPHAYLVAHHPVLVLEVNGAPPAGWPKDSQEHTFDMGPYMISHLKFTPSYKVLSHVDEAQIPWGVVRLEFRDEKIVFGAIAPRAGSRSAGRLPHREAELLPLPQRGTRGRTKVRRFVGVALRIRGGVAQGFCRLHSRSSREKSARADARQSAIR